MLRHAVAGADRRVPSLVLVHGEAGVGKTALVRAVCNDARRSGTQVLWGACLRFGATGALHLPVVMALEGWLRDADPDDRERVLRGVPDAGALLRSVPTDGGVGGLSPPSPPLAIATALIERILDLSPTVLVIDDVQWADAGTRDVLAYLVAQFSRQPLAVLTTLRDLDPSATDEFRSWVADVRRMPRVTDVALGRLDRAATDAQVCALLGTSSLGGLAEQVFERSQGNAYLTELLVAGLDASVDELPEDLPELLNEALLAAWRRLPQDARVVTRCLAVAGGPAELAALRQVQQSLDPLVEVSEGVRDAVAGGIVLNDHTSVWFRHPLLAEVLLGTLLPDEAARVHAAWATVLSGTFTSGIDALRRDAGLALHQEAAGDFRSAFDACLRAAELAEQQRAPREVARHLVHAAALWEDGAPDPRDRAELLALLERAIRFCTRTERGADAHALTERGLGVVDEDQEPLCACRLLMEWADLEWTQGNREDPPLDVVRRAAELALPFPGSAELASALAMTSNCFRWLARFDEAAESADAAVVAAQSSGSARAMSFALGARSQTQSDPALVDRDNQEAVDWARRSGEDLALTYALGARANHLYASGRVQEHLALTRDMLDHALDNGRGALESAVLADALLALGDLRGAEDALRAGFASPTSLGSAIVRLRIAAAQLAVRQGDLAAAEMHSQRAHEAMPGLDRRVGSIAATAVADILMATGRPEEALAHLRDAIPGAAFDSPWADEILTTGARAAADLADLGRDRREPHVVAAAITGLEQLLAARAALPGKAFAPGSDEDLVQPAMAAVFDAEHRRALGEGDLADAWHTASTTCEGARLGWLRHIALWRLGAALIDQGGARVEAAQALRAAYRYACEQGAGALQVAVEDTARLARISLSEASTIEEPRVIPSAFKTLTHREREVLAQLIADRTYAEIATALFISRKTVSVHVSNMLHKTGTSSGRELAALATRLGWGPLDGG